MSILKTIIQGEAHTIGFRINPEYDLSRLRNFYIQFGNETMDSALVGGIIRVELSSATTARYYGIVDLYVTIDDTIFDTRKTKVGVLNFIQPDGALTNLSVNDGYSIIIGITISELATLTDVILLEAMKAPGYSNGKSAYQSYLETTSDVPVKTEGEWIISLNGNDGYTPIKDIDYFDGNDGKSAYQSYLDTTLDVPPMTEGEWANQIGNIINAYVLNIDFAVVEAFIFNVPAAMKFTSITSEGTAPTLSIALNTDMARYDKLTITPTALGLVTLTGTLL